MAIKPATISFKNNDEDKILAEWIYSHSNISGFIKDILREKMLSQTSLPLPISENKTNNHEKVNKADSKLIDFDF